MECFVLRSAVGVLYGVSVTSQLNSSLVRSGEAGDSCFDGVLAGSVSTI